MDEQIGRKILKSFLDQVGATDQQPTEDRYNPVDYYFTLKGVKVVAEIKVRDIQYENYSTHLMEQSKYEALLKEQQQKHLDYGYYICFFKDSDKIIAYWYSLNKIKLYAKKDIKYCRRTTAIDSGSEYKNVLLIPTDKAQKFIFKNNKWQKL